LLIVMSPGYIGSEWCAKERNAFLSLARDRVSSGRVFIVRYRDTDRSAIPPEFRDLMGYKFWTQDQSAGGVTRPLGIGGVKDDEREYWGRLYNLGDDLAKKLKELRATQKLGSTPYTATASVFLARSTDDMETREEELVAYLTQAGLSILPQTWYPEESEQAFEEAMQADLNRCSVFIQLLSKFPGRKFPFTRGRRLPVFQHDIAQAGGKPVLLWRELADDPASVSDEWHRELLERARACGFEEFKRTVVETVRRKPQQPKVQRSNVAVFVNADQDDLDIARQLSELLAREGVESYWPIMGGSPEKVRQDLEENLKACDGLVLIYGATEPSWVRDQLRQGRKILGQRDRDLAALAIYLGPPPQKHELAVALPQLVTLDGRAGVTPQSLRPFVERLTGEV
ncbi:MAG: hypothetical protein JOY71_19335, partial [Acetobacteraceae bacterium]|nr:hypothetical protein [Acetobacteraceae bacterium]